MNKSSKKRSLWIARILITILSTLLTISIYYRTLFEIPDQFFNSFGPISFCLISVLILLAYGAYIDVGKEGKYLSLTLLLTLRSALPGISFVVLIYLGSLMIDPWLAKIIFNRIFRWAGPLMIFIGWFILFIKRDTISQGNDLEKIDIGGSESRYVPFLVIATVFLLGLGMRLVNLDGYPPAIDEFTHIKNAIFIIEGDPIEYFRSLWTVTVPIAGMFKIFGVSLFNARLTMILINMLAIIPLYLLLLKFDHVTAMAGVILFVVNPSIIFMSQMARDYAVAPIFIYSVSYAATRLLSQDINVGWKGLLRSSYKEILFLLLIFLWMMNDQASISSVVLASIAGLIGLGFIKLFVEYKFSLRWKILISIFMVLTMVQFLLNTSKFMLSRFRFTPEYFSLLTSNTYVNWSSIFPAFGWILIAWAIIMVFRSVNNDSGNIAHPTLFNSSMFLALMVYSATLLFAGKLSPNGKYFVVFVYYLIPVFALLIGRSYWWLSRKARGYFGFIQIIGVSFLLLLVVNFAGINANFRFTGGKNLVSDEFYLNYQPAYDFLIKNIKPGDALLSDQLHKYDLLQERVLDDIMILGPSQLKRSGIGLDGFLEDQDNGWVLFSRNLKNVPDEMRYEDFSTDAFNFKFFGDKGSDIDIWYWERIN